MWRWRRNLAKPEAGQPVLLSFDEVVGMFHEFGHALHGMLSNVRYRSLSGTNLPADFVEYPSQCNEMWARDPKVVAHFAFHYQSGAPMPPELLRQVIAAQQFNTGFLTSEYVIAAIMDMAWHSIPGTPTLSADDVANFETTALKNHNVLYALAPPRYHTTYFLHAFNGEDYAAGYYAYLWSEVLARANGRTQRAVQESLWTRPGCRPSDRIPRACPLGGAFTLTRRPFLRQLRNPTHLVGRLVPARQDCRTPTLCLGPIGHDVGPRNEPFPAVVGIGVKSDANARADRQPLAGNDKWHL
jgi:hypothetical protein